MQKINTDFLIIGQGIAGTLLHFCLKKRGQKVHVIDRHHKGASSIVAAGGINPVTGKRFVKSWKIDQLLPVVNRMYRELEEALQIPIFTPRNVYRILNNPGEENTWIARSADPGYAKYFVENPTVDEFEKYLKPSVSVGEISNGGQVDLPGLITAYREKLIADNELTTEDFEYEKLDILDNQIQYKNITATKVIFCEGAASAENPFFKHLPFQLSKGEALTIKIDKARLEKIVRRKISLVPMPDKNYWAGATNSWEQTDDIPTKVGKAELIRYLNEMLDVPYEILNHTAAFRPTIKDRRPMLGAHSEISNLLIFNGLGTKGASLAPFLAEAFCDWILEDTPLSEEVDIKRFKTN